MTKIATTTELFLQDLFTRLFSGRNSCCCFCVEFVKVFLMHRYSADIFFSISGPSGILGSDGKWNIV